MNIQIHTIDGALRLIRAKRRRGMIWFRYVGTEVARAPTDSLVTHLASYRSGEWQTRSWGDLEIICGKGEVRISLRREALNHLLPDQTRRDLAALAARPA